MSTPSLGDNLSAMVPETDARAIVVGGPKTGKTTMAQDSGWTTVAQPGEAEDALSDDHVVIDDFYVQFEQCFGDQWTVDSSIQDAFDSLCRRESGICFTVRPRELDWLLLHRERAADLLDLGNTTVCHLAYTEEDAVRICKELDGGDRDITPHLDRLQYRYSFEATVDGLDSYNTYIPYLLIEIAEHDLSSGLVPDAIRQAVSTVGATADWYDLGQSYADPLAGLWEKVPNEIGSLIETAKRTTDSGLAHAGIGSAVVAGVAPPAAFVALPLVCKLLFSDDAGEEAKDIFGQILSPELLPHARAELEAQLDLPPRTIDSLQRLTDPAVLESLEAQVATDQERIEEIEMTVEAFQSDIDELEEIDDALQERIASMEQLVSERLRKAIRTPEQGFAQDHTARRQLLEQRAGLSPETASNKTERVVGAYREAFGPTASSVVESTDGDPFMAVIQGAHGYESWACLEEIAAQYRSAGYVVGVVNTADAEFIEPRLRALRQDERPVALLYRYEPSTSPEEIRRTFGREVAGLFDALVVACTPAAYYSLRRVWKTPPDVTSSLLSGGLEPDATFRIDVFDDGELAPVVNAVGVTDSELVCEIIDGAEGRPFVAFHSAVTALVDGADSRSDQSGIKSLYPPFEETVTMLEERAPPSVNVRHLVDTLAAVGYIRGDSYDDSLATLATLAGIDQPGEAVEFAREYMPGLIQRDGTGCRLSPAAIGIVWNENRWFRETFGQRARVFDDIVKRICEGDERYLPALVTSLKSLASHHKLDEWDQPAGLSDALTRLLELAGKTDQLQQAQLLYLAVHYGLQQSPETLHTLCERNATENVTQQYSRALSRYAALYLVHGENSEFKRLIGLAKDLYVGPDGLDIPDAAHDIWIYGYAFYEVTDVLSVEDGLEFVDRIDSYLDEAVVESERADTYRIHAYAVGVWPHLQLGANADEYAEWVVEFERRAVTNTEYDLIAAIIELYTALVSVQPKTDPNAIDDWLRLVETRVDAAGGRQALEEGKQSRLMHSRSYYLTEYYTTLLATLLEQLSDEQVEQWIDLIGVRAAVRFQDISDERYRQDGSHVAYAVRPLCLLYGGTVRRFDGDTARLRALLPMLAESAEAVLQAEVPDHYEQICIVCGQLVGNYLLTTGPDQIRRVIDSVVDAVLSLDETEHLIWVGLTFEPAAIVEAAAEVATLGSPDRTERLFSALWDEYRTRAANRDQRTVIGCRAANSFSDVHTFYGLTVLRTAWYKHPEHVVDGWWTRLEQDVAASGAHAYQIPTGDSQLVTEASDRPVLRTYAIAYRMLTYMFSPNAQNIDWIEQLEWRLYDRNGDDAIAVVLADTVIQQFEYPTPYKQRWIGTLAERFDNLPPASAGRGYLLVLDGLPLDKLTMQDCRVLVPWLGSSNVLDAIDAFADRVGDRSLASESLNSVLSGYDVSKPAQYLRDRVRAVSRQR